MWPVPSSQVLTHSCVVAYKDGGALRGIYPLQFRSNGFVFDDGNHSNSANNSVAIHSATAILFTLGEYCICSVRDT